MNSDTVHSSHSRLAALLLITSVLPLVASELVTNPPNLFFRRVHAVEGVRWFWIMSGGFFHLAALVGGFGLVLLARNLNGTTARSCARIALVLSWSSIFSVLVGTLMYIASRFQTANWVLDLGFPLLMLATTLSGIGLFVSRRLRYSGLIVALLGAVTLVLRLSTWRNLLFLRATEILILLWVFTGLALLVSPRLSRIRPEGHQPSA